MKQLPAHVFYHHLSSSSPSSVQMKTLKLSIFQIYGVGGAFLSSLHTCATYVKTMLTNVSKPFKNSSSVLTDFLSH